MEATLSSAEKFRADFDVVRWVENIAIGLRIGKEVQHCGLQQGRPNDYFLLFAAIFVKKVNAKLRNSSLIRWNTELFNSGRIVLETAKDLVPDVPSAIRFAKGVQLKCRQEMQSKIRQSLAGFHITDELVQEFVDRVTESCAATDSSLFESSTQTFLNSCSLLYNACRKSFPELDFTAANKLKILNELIFGLESLREMNSAKALASGGNGAPRDEVRTLPTGMHQSNRRTNQRAGDTQEEMKSPLQRNRQPQPQQIAAAATSSTQRQRSSPARGSSPLRDSTGSRPQQVGGTNEGVSSAVQISGQSSGISMSSASTTLEKSTTSSEFSGYKVVEITDPRRSSVIAKRYDDLFHDSSNLVWELENSFPQLDSGKIAESVIHILEITYEGATRHYGDLRAEVARVLNFRGGEKIKKETTVTNQDKKKTNSIEGVKKKADVFLKKCVLLCWDMILRKQRLILVADDKVFRSSHHERLAGESDRAGDINYYAWPCLIEKETKRVLLKGKVVTQAKEMMIQK